MRDVTARLAVSQTNTGLVDIIRRELGQAAELSIPIKIVVGALMTVIVTVGKHDAVSIGVAIHWCRSLVSLSLQDDRIHATRSSGITYAQPLSSHGPCRELSRLSVDAAVLHFGLELTPVVDWIRPVEIHLQDIDVARRRLVVAAASLTADAMLGSTDVAAVGPPWRVEDLIAVLGLGLEYLPELDV